LALQFGAAPPPFWISAFDSLYGDHYLNVQKPFVALVQLKPFSLEKSSFYHPQKIFVGIISILKEH
jgi:hypothetical protein